MTQRQLGNELASTIVIVVNAVCDGSTNPIFVAFFCWVLPFVLSFLCCPGLSFVATLWLGDICFCENAVGSRSDSGSCTRFTFNQMSQRKQGQ
jgi:hypothetical protein